jgi:hypothetical protein
MQFVPALYKFISISIFKTKASGLCNYYFAFNHTIYKTAEPHQPIPHSLQDCTLLAARSRDAATVLHPPSRNTQHTIRNYHREPGLHSPAHVTPNYSTPIAKRLCRAVESGSGSPLNRRNQFGFHLTHPA